MPGFRIGAPALPAKDIAYIRALVRLFSYSDKLGWSFVDAAPYTAVVAEAPPAANRSGAIDALLLTMPGHAQLTQKIAYPIRADQLRDWLKRVGDALLPGGAPANAASASAGYTVRYKLRRWPSVLQLDGDPLRIRMATQMSRKALSAADLAGLTGADIGVCAGFIGVLHKAGLLAEVTAPQPPAPASTAPAPASSAGFTSSLLNNIRRRIGLAGK
ncbi:hypothetical protein INH39_16975 [Massilia violaceinigra]|uniref:Winged helix-turn-helix domain-containing protein n=1 Tax=Massilia violaceinigra TaxID=2045208 RepID=A0ABY3ZXN7_9BURK|nr:hypothetical protein [Massilia violaceinigra]UOD27231.1 hypothetical protein INH39_16975 [Massilia violaceinigra]